MTGMEEAGSGPYKVVEIANVCDEEIEGALNRFTADGYRFESIQFVTRTGSSRPSMAFLFFRRSSGDEGE